MEEDMLPENVMFDVLSRLPVKTIITCKCVCKRWRDIVSDTYFVDLHLSRSREEAVMILECMDVKPEPGTLKWLKIEHEHEHEHVDTVKSLNLKQCVPPITDWSLVLPIGSANGLVSYWATNDSIYIFNPVLEEYMTLPRQPPGGGLTTLGYGFGVSTAGEYKVIRIKGRRVSINPSETAAWVWAVETEVYTLGADQWRSLRQTPNSPKIKGQLQCPVVHLNSHLYWLTDDKIYDFDLNRETSELFPYPPATPGDNQIFNPMLGVLKGRLSCICWCSSGGMEVWVMKEESTNWYEEITVIKPVIQLGLWKHQRLCLIDGLEGASVLLVHVDLRDKLMAYCLSTNMILSGTPILWNDSSSIMTYRPSFVKLDNFGLERVHSIPCTTTTHRG